MSSFAVSPSGNDARGSGGKILRDRPRATPRRSPYFRPQQPRPPSQSRTWFSGLVSGAGKLLSAVFRPSPSPPLSESGSSSHGDDSDSDSDNNLLNDDRDNGDDILSKHGKEFDKNGASPTSNNNQTVGTQPVLQKNEAKLVIEQLIRQETFSWDECIELTKIIESRVVESPTTGTKGVTQNDELHNWAFRSKFASPGAWRSLSQAGNSSERFPYSASRLGALSYSSYVVQAQSPHFQDIAVMEARKWIKEKKMEPCSKSELEPESSELCKAKLPHVSGSEMSSPVDVAKSYMRGQPQWPSPSMSDIRSNIILTAGLQSDESPYLTSSKELKRSSLAIGSWDATDESRRVRLKLSDDFPEPPGVRQTDTSAKTTEHETVQSTSIADIREVVSITHDSNSSPPVKSADASGGSCSFRLKLNNDMLEPPADREIHSSAKTMEHETVQNTSVPGKREVVIIHDSNSLPPAKSADASGGFLAELSAAQDGVTPSDGKLAAVNPLVTDDVVVSTNPAPVGNTSDSKPNIIASEEANPSNAVDERDSLMGNAGQPKDLSDVSETYANDSRSQEGDDFQAQNRPASRSGADGYFPLSPPAELNGDPSTNEVMELGKIDQNSIGPSHIMFPTSSFEEDCKLSSEASLEVLATDEANISVDGVQSGSDSKQEKAPRARRRGRPKSSNGAGKKATVNKEQPLSLSESRSSDGQEVKPIKSKVRDEPPEPEHEPTSTRVWTGKSNSGAVKRGTTSGYTRRGRGRGK